MSCCKTSYILCDSIPSCLMQLVVKTHIVSDDLTLKIVDKFNKVYYVDKTSNGQGEVTIQLQDDNTDPLNPLTKDLPLALLNEYAGDFKLFILDSNRDHVKWTISGVDYDALVFNVKDITPVEDSYMLDPTYAEGVEGQFNL